MSQYQLIADYLAQTRDPAADDALRLALDRAEEPFKTQILQTLLRRGDPAATADLIERLDTLDPAHQKSITTRIANLHAGLRRAAARGTPHAKRNALNLIRQARYTPMADVVAALLRQRSDNLAPEAGAVLIELAREAATMTDLSRRSETKTEPDRILTQTLQHALQNYKLHGRHEAIHAAMILMPATETEFWKNALGRHEPIGRAVAELLLHNQHPDLAPFCLSALNLDDLRITAVRALTEIKNPNYLLRAAEFYLHNSDPEIRRGLSLIKKPVWLTTPVFHVEQFSARQQLFLLPLVMATGAEESLKAGFLGNLLEKGQAVPARKAFGLLERFDAVLRYSALRRGLRNEHESVALAALQAILRKTTGNAKGILADALKSPHETVRQQATEYMQGHLLTSYWRHFDRLSPRMQARAGRALFKMGLTVQDHWLRQAWSELPESRLCAIRVARAAGRVDTCLTTILDLSKDKDSRVRSCAIGALGEIPMSVGILESIKERLIGCLKDSDPRVRANAIEALGRTGGPGVGKHLVPFVAGTHARQRANAIKAMLDWKVKSAGAAVEQMLQDARPAHRRSGQWLKNVQHITEELKAPVLLST